MNSEKYIKAIDEIKVDENLKTKAINNIKKKNRPKIIYKLANAMLVVLVIFSLVWIINADNSRKNINTDPIESFKINLPTIQSYDELSKFIKSNENKTGHYMNQEESKFDSLESNFLVNGDYSKTNVQVQGVDEADIVKTDGKYIYYIVERKIVIVDAQNSNNIVLTKELECEKNFSPNELYINNNKLILIGAKVQEEQNSINNKKVAYDMISYNTLTKAIVYDISNVNEPKVLREVEIDGNYISSRMIDNNIYLVAYKPLYTNLLKKEEAIKPTYKDTAVNNEYSKISYENIYYFPESKENSYLYITSFNINNKRKANIETFLGGGNTIYVSNNNLYIANTIYDENWTKPTTEIYKFKLENDNVQYIAKGSVKGTVLNQFSMDEYNENFRIAVTEGQNWEKDKTKNNLYVLDSNLSIIGKLEGLAEGESIYSVRFMGNKVYMVTFEQVDPLFVIDLSQPTQPKVLGKLKIPGFSQYLHPYDETHIIGFGYDTKVVKEYGRERVVTTGMKMALFDVSDVANPKEMYVEKIGTAGTYSDILYNHKSLLFSKEKNIIAFPIYITKSEGNNKTELTFQGAIIYGLDLSNGFTLKGKISHMQVNNGYKDYEYSKAIDRIIYIKDTLYTLSKGLIKATNMDTMKEQSSLNIKVEETYY